jgi:hypothetical protein
VGWCSEFGVEISSCGHPMVAGSDACHCDVCGASAVPAVRVASTGARMSGRAARCRSSSCARHMLVPYATALGRPEPGLVDA